MYELIRTARRTKLNLFEAEVNVLVPQIYGRIVFKLDKKGPNDWVGTVQPAGPNTEAIV